MRKNASESNMTRVRTLLLAGVSLLAVPVALSIAANQAEGQSVTQAAAADAPSIVGMRRMTGTQYRHTIDEVFGSEVVVDGRFEPDSRVDGMLAVGSSKLSVSSAGFAQYFSTARSVAEQVTGEELRGDLVPCAPASVAAADDACARQFFSKYGAALLRRPLEAAELTTAVELAGAGAAENKDFYAGLRLGLISFLTSPDFLFRIEVAEADPENPGAQRLDPYSMASRLSFLMWDAPPDSELRRAAAAGELYTRAGLKKQVDRLASDDERLEMGLRSFFEDMLMFEKFETLSKDGATYPMFSASVANSAREQTLRFLIDKLVIEEGDYRDVFTSQETWMDRTLAGVYDVPFGFGDNWIKHKFPEDSPQSGLLTQTTFLSIFSHPGTSSPTLRGIGIREIFMCEPIPLPPPDVDFSLVRDSTSNTVRDRLIEHAGNPGCATCHNVMDPPGLALEHFDGLGQPQLLENGKPINVNSHLDGVEFVGSRGLGRTLANSPKTSACLVNKLYSYGVGRAPTQPGDEAFLAQQTKSFAETGYRVTELLKQIATAPAFYRINPDAPDVDVSTLITAASAVSAEQMAIGHAAFDRTCAGCHGPTGNGVENVAPKLVGLSDFDSVRKQVQEGGGRMPPMGALLSQAEIDLVAKYVTSGMSEE